MKKKKTTLIKATFLENTYFEGEVYNGTHTITKEQKEILEATSFYKKGKILIFNL